MGGAYVDNFGAQWTAFRRVQIDRLSGHDLSRSRFLADTGWAPDWIRDKLILDAGCGAGRFSDVMAELGGNVVGCDLSDAVDACWENMNEDIADNAGRGDVSIVQADLCALPFAPKSFDAIHCAGVIQHTENPEAVMRRLVTYLKPGGKLFFNFYEQSTTTKLQIVKYFLRNWTTKWSYKRLYYFSQALCMIFFVPSFVLSKIPVLRSINRFWPICSTHPAGISVALQYQLTLLDTVDWYGPVYEQRQRHTDVAQLLADEGLIDVKSDDGRAWAAQAIEG